MHTPDEIKKGLECCVQGNVCRKNCPYGNSLHGIVECTTNLSRDALAYIHQLEAERDALLTYLTDSRYVHCSICKHDTGEGVMGCKRIREVDGPCFEWRGVQKEE